MVGLPRLALLCLLLCVSGSGCHAPVPRHVSRHEGAETSAKRPNIVLILSDDQDYEHFGFMGHPLARTPRIDQLASRGVVFPNTHVTAPRCRPSLATLLSGKWPQQHGIYYNVGPGRLGSEGTLSQQLADAGYAVLGGGKFWEGDPREMGFARGTAAGFESGNRTFVRSGQEGLFRAIEELSDDQPLFVWWAPMLPHTPHNPPDRFLRLFDPNRIPLPDWLMGDPDSYRELEHVSLAMGAWLDEGVGELVDRFHSLGLYEQTLFVFMIDNGWANGLVSKGSAYEKGLRTPLIFSWEGRIAPRIDESLISTVDIYATILDFAGVRAERFPIASSLRPLIRGSETTGREALFGGVFPRGATPDASIENDLHALYMRDAEWKYILYTQERDPDYFTAGQRGAWLRPHVEPDRGEERLFHLTSDPHELNDLSTDPDQRTRIERMREAALDWWARSGGGPIDVASVVNPPHHTDP